MDKSSQAGKASQILIGLMQQNQTLKDLGSFYCTGAGLDLLKQIPAGGRLLFSGTGSAYNSARLAALQCCHNGLDAQAVEPEELLAWPKSLLDQYSLLFFLMTSNRLEEFESLFEKVDPIRSVVISNQPESILKLKPALGLPLFTDAETWTGSRSFLNAGVILWLVVRQLSQKMDGSESDQLKRLRQRVQLMIEGRAILSEQWQRCLPGGDSFVFCGSGLQMAAAWQAQLTFAVWAGVQANAWSLSALQQSGLDLGQNGWVPLLFQFINDGDHIQRAVRSVQVVDGFPLCPPSEPRPSANLDEGLSVLLNVLSCQIFAQHLCAEQTG